MDEQDRRNRSRLIILLLVAGSVFLALVMAVFAFGFYNAAR